MFSGGVILTSGRDQNDFVILLILFRLFFFVSFLGVSTGIPVLNAAGYITDLKALLPDEINFFKLNSCELYDKFSNLKEI